MRDVAQKSLKGWPWACYDV